MENQKYIVNVKRLTEEEREISIKLNAYKNNESVSKTSCDVEICNTIVFSDTCNSFQYNKIYTFQELSTLTSIPKYRVNQKIKNASYTFCNCRNVESIDLSPFDGTQPTDMTGMFFCCQKVKHLDLTGVDFSHVLNYRIMFDGCSSLQQIDGVFDLSNIKNDDELEGLNNMFKGCPSTLKVKLKNIPNNFFAPITPKKGGDFGLVKKMTCPERMGLRPEQIEIVE